MAQNIEPTPAGEIWDIHDLARYLRLKESTVYTMRTRAPESLPPSMPTLGLRWNSETVRKWAQGELPTVSAPEPPAKKKRAGKVPNDGK
jgi:hypothetical protein